MSWPITGDKQVCKFTLNSVRIENIQPALIGKVCNEKKKKDKQNKEAEKVAQGFRSLSHASTFAGRSMCDVATSTFKCVGHIRFYFA